MKILTDYDNMAINLFIAQKKKDPSLSQFGYFSDFILDLDNMIVYVSNKNYRFDIALTPLNDRARARVSSRKGDSHQFVIDPSKLKT